MSSALSKPERLTFIPRACRLEEAIDDRLRDDVPPDEREEFERWIGAIEQAMAQLMTVMA